MSHIYILLPVVGRVPDCEPWHIVLRSVKSACMHRTELPRWCKAFEACDVREVAIVGNGPLSAQQRSELNSGRFQVVLRFNFLNNRCMHAKQLPATSTASSKSSAETARVAAQA